MYFYPTHGQSEARQDRDRFECYQWAKAQTGIDPGMTPVRGPGPVVVAPQVTGAGAAVGAVTGAAIGAATSGRRGGGEAVVLGAIIGTMLGAVAESATAQARAQAEAQAYYDARSQPLSLHQVDAFRRAMGACMSSRGYTIG
jgi:outer membrane lipoprotein SlyB